MALQTQRLYRFIPASSRPPAAVRTAKLYQFPAPAAACPADTRIDDPRTNQTGAHRAVAIEMAAAIRAFALWLGWRIMHLSASR